MIQRRGPNVAASVHQRLLNKARQTNRPFNELLQYFAMERFLYRLSRSVHANQFVLKGALMFTAWRAPVTRPTMDIDLLGITDNRVDAIVAVVKDICRQDVEPDGLVFDAAGVEGERIVEDADYAGVRARFRGTLSTARIAMQLDIGFGDVVVPESETAEYPTPSGGRSFARVDCRIYRAALPRSSRASLCSSDRSRGPLPQGRASKDHGVSAGVKALAGADRAQLRAGR